MMAAIYPIIVALGSIATLILWLLRRYRIIFKQIRKLKEQVDAITTKIVVLERLGRTTGSRRRVVKLYAQRELLNRKLRRLRDAHPRSG